MRFMREKSREFENRKDRRAASTRWRTGCSLQFSHSPTLQRPEPLPTPERTLGGGLLREHLSRRRLSLHGAGDRQLGRFIIVLEDFLVVVRFPMDEYTAHNHEVLRLVLGNDSLLDAIGDRLGDG